MSQKKWNYRKLNKKLQDLGEGDYCDFYEGKTKSKTYFVGFAQKNGYGILYLLRHNYIITK